VIPELVAATVDVEPLAGGRLGDEVVAVHRPATGKVQLDQVDARHRMVRVERPPEPKCGTAPAAFAPPCHLQVFTAPADDTNPDDNTGVRVLITTTLIPPICRHGDGRRGDCPGLLGRTGVSVAAGRQATGNRSSITSRRR
jgi:hypothetical protein